MNCKHCSAELHYGNKYCRNCGEKVEKDAFLEDYNRSIWGKLQKAEDWYETLTLQKITGHILFKVFVLLVILAVGAWQIYTNYSDIKLLPGEEYSITYEKETDEYKIEARAAEFDLSLYLPKRTEKVVLTGYGAEEAVEAREIIPSDYVEEDMLKIEKDAYTYFEIESFEDTKSIDKIKCRVEK